MNLYLVVYGIEASNRHQVETSSKLRLVTCGRFFSSQEPFSLMRLSIESLTVLRCCTQRDSTLARFVAGVIGGKRKWHGAQTGTVFKAGPPGAVTQTDGTNMSRVSK